MANKLQLALKRKAAAWAGQLTRLAKSLAPAHVRPAISSKVEEKDGKFIIRTTASKKLVPDARAQEYGSGLRARRGPKQKYLIHPKQSPFLEFEGTNEFAGWLIRTKEVKHPGIRAANDGKGYIGPAQKEIRKKLKAELKSEVKNAIQAELRAGFK